MKTTEKTYTLTIPRPQYDRLGNAFELDDTYFKRLNLSNDTVEFCVTETQRVRFAQYATEANREKKRTGHWYWITQMFLEENINKYTMG
jgi:hypothetical protein